MSVGPLISAHRGGGDEVSGPNSLAAVEAAVRLGVDLVEVDVRLRDDGVPVLGHDVVDELSPTLDDALVALGGTTLLHLDLKDRDPEAEVVARAVAALGVERVVVTTAEDADVRALVAWARTAAPGLKVGLSTSSPTSVTRWRARAVSWFPRTRMRRSAATLVASHHVLARWWLARWAARRGLPLLVWTVDEDRDLLRWLADPRVTIVTTNRPARAMALRSRIPGPR